MYENAVVGAGTPADRDDQRHHGLYDRSQWRFRIRVDCEIADERGITHKEPRTDEEWKEVRRHALVLLEAPNLLIMEGRKVANPGEKAENPQVELQPEEIQKLIDSDRPSFVRRARRLQDAAAMALKAIDVKDRDALFRSLESIDHACENCHLHYWYPNDKRAHEAAKESGVVVD